MSNSGQTLGEAAPIRDSVASRQRERPDLQQINTGNLHSKGKRQSDTARRVSLAQPSGTAGSTSVTEAVFEQLRVIQALQEEIAADHIKLENLQNNGATTSTPGSVTSPNLGASRNQFRPRGTGATAASKANTLNPQANKQAAAAAYDKLAEGFEERQKDVEAIMNKVGCMTQEGPRNGAYA